MRRWFFHFSCSHAFRSVSRGILCTQLVRSAGDLFDLGRKKTNAAIMMRMKVAKNYTMHLIPLNGEVVNSVGGDERDPLPCTPCCRSRRLSTLTAWALCQTGKEGLGRYRHTEELCARVVSLGTFRVICMARFGRFWSPNGLINTQTTYSGATDQHGVHL